MTARLKYANLSIQNWLTGLMNYVNFVKKGDARNSNTSAFLLRKKNKKLKGWQKT